MKEEDLHKLAEMKGRRENKKAVLAFFKLMGYSEEEIFTAMEQVKPIEPKKEAKPVNVVKFQFMEEDKSHLILAAVLLIISIGLVVYLLLPFVPGVPTEEQKTKWKVSVDTRACSTNSLTLKVTNAEISGMPVTLFSIKENNARCSPPTNLQTMGIGMTITCRGVFDDGAIYTLISNNTIDVGFICNYQ